MSQARHDDFQILFYIVDLIGEKTACQVLQRQVHRGHFLPHRVEGFLNRDPLPTQVEAGAAYRLKFIDHYVKDTELRIASSYLNSRAFGGKSVRLGTDVMYQGKVHLRAGYVGHDRRGDASASLGFGLQSGAFVFDIARTFGGLPADNGQTPVYVSLRYLF